MQILRGIFKQQYLPSMQDNRYCQSIRFLLLLWIFLNMYCDIVMPDKNEKEFIEVAETLGYKAICFCYNGKIHELKLETDLEVFTSSIGKGKADIQLFKADPGLRNVIETKKADVVFDLGLNKQKDSLHYRSSDLNHVTAQLLAKNNVVLGIAFNTILSCDGMFRAQVLGRVKQNIMLAKKYGFNIAIFSFADSQYKMRSPQDLAAFGISLGLEPKNAKAAVNTLYGLIKDKAKKASGYYICDGVEVVE